MRPALRSLAVVAGLTGTVLMAAVSGIVSSSATPEVSLELKSTYRRPADIPFPKDNPFTVVKAELGRTLFFDPRVSGAGTVSCATCHNPGLGWGDGLALGVGAQHLARHSPTILNVAWISPLMWDGRFATLEDQAAGPITAPAEMNQTMAALEAKLGAIPGYLRQFDAAFPEEGITTATIGKALATFERTVVSEQAPFDRWIEGDESAIDASAKRGFLLFNGKAHCAACHSGWRFTDDSFHDIGLADDDIGRGKIRAAVPLMQHAFKTPGLRNIAQRAPYMHNGSAATLVEVMRHYIDGFVARPSLSPEMRRLTLTATETDDLVNFMLALTSEDKPVSVPLMPTKESR
jgi:cytochrome c peroxidase